MMGGMLKPAMPTAWDGSRGEPDLNIPHITTGREPPCALRFPQLFRAGA